MTIRQHRIIQYIAITLIISVGAGWYYNVKVRGAQTVSDESPSFQADLKNTLDLQAGVGVPTFTRATTATVTDFEGLIKTVKSGEARFEGARRVENLYTNPENAAAWTRVYNGGIITANNTTAPDGTVTATKMDVSAGTSAQTDVSGSITSVVGKQYTVSMWIKADSNGTVRFSENIGTAFYLPSFSVTTSWRRISVTYTANSTLTVVGFVGSGTLGVVYVWHPQLEEVTGQANQNPSEYVSTGVLSAPYHGANVDGVQYFVTQNGNTVASNVVTEATGAVIPDATLHGYVAEGARTNLALQSEAFDNASWTKTNSSITPNSVVSPAGTLTADTIINDTTNGTHRVSMNFVASQQRTISVFAKQGTASFVGLSTSGTLQSAVFNLSNGTIETTGANAVATITSVGGGWYRCSVTETTSVGQFIIISIGETAAQAVAGTSYIGTITNIYLWGAQVELSASFASSYIPTTTASVTRNADVLTYPTVGNIQNAVGTTFAQFITNAPNLYQGLIGTALVTGTTPLGLSYNNKTQTYDGTHIIPTSNSLSVGAFNRTASKWSGTSSSVVLNAGTIATGVYGTWSLGSNFYVGTGRETFFGTIRNVKIWKKALTDGQLTNMTSINTAVSQSAVKQTTIGTDGASFQADLKNTLDLQAGVGVPTFTRADGADRRATVTDFEGLIKTVKSGEARFEGSRRVENLVAKTANFTHSVTPSTGWNNTNITPTMGISDPNGGINAVTLTATNNNAITYTVKAYGVAYSGLFVNSIFIRRRTGSGIIYIANTRGDLIDVTGILSSGWKRISLPANTTDSGGSAEFLIKIAISGDAVDVYVPQMESVLGQANQNPSEYVSTGVLTSAPYHGANVDGVKYFTTQNGNTVASNVVTEAVGTAIPDATLHGYVAEGARTNKIISSDSYESGTYWIKQNVTTTPNSDGIGAKIIADTNNTTYKVIRSATTVLTASTRNTLSFKVKQGGYNYCGVVLYGNNGRVAIDIINKTATYYSTTNATTVFTTLPDGYLKVELSIDAGAGVNPYVAIGPLPQIQDGTVSWTGNGTDGVYVKNIQLEAGAFASSYIPTTTASVTRNNDILTYPVSGNVNLSVGTMYAEGNTKLLSQSAWIGAGGGNLELIKTLSPTQMRNYDGTNLRTYNVATVADTVYKRAFRFGSSIMNVFSNGVKMAETGTFNNSLIGFSQIGIGNNQTSTEQPFGTIRNVKIWKKALTDAQLTDMTSSDPDVAAGAIQQTVVNDSQNTKVTNGLVGLWSFDGPDMNGNSAIDRSGNGNNGTLTNGPVKAIGMVVSGLSFDGVDDYVANGTGYNGVKTVSFWVKPNTTTQSIIDFNGTQTVDIAAGTLRANSFTTPTIYIDGTATATFPDTDWHFVTITTDTAINASAFNMGKISSTYFAGKLDEVRTYNRALSATEVASLYNLGR